MLGEHSFFFGFTGMMLKTVLSRAAMIVVDVVVVAIVVVAAAVKLASGELLID